MFQATQGEGTNKHAVQDDENNSDEIRHFCSLLCILVRFSFGKVSTKFRCEAHIFPFPLVSLMVLDIFYLRNPLCIFVSLNSQPQILSSCFSLLLLTHSHRVPLTHQFPQLHFTRRTTGRQKSSWYSSELRLPSLLAPLLLCLLFPRRCRRLPSTGGTSPNLPNSSKFSTPPLS